MHTSIKEELFIHLCLSEIFITMFCELKKDRHLKIIILSIVAILLLFTLKSAALFLSLFALYGFHHYNLHNELRLQSIRLFFISLICFLPLLILVLSLSEYFLGQFPQQDLVNELKSSSLERKVIFFIGIGILSPLIEELSFRVIIYKAIKNYIGIFPSLFLSSLFFATIHQNILALPTLFLIGCFFSFLYQKYNTIVFPVFAHALFNLIMGTLIIV